MLSQIVNSLSDLHYLLPAPSILAAIGWLVDARRINEEFPQVHRTARVEVRLNWSRCQRPVAFHCGIKEKRKSRRLGFRRPKSFLLPLNACRIQSCLRLGSLTLLPARQLLDTDVAELHQRGPPFAILPFRMQLQGQRSPAWNSW